jgi:NADH-quinone oxidoreductase subunit G
LTQRASFPPGDAREDWAIFRALSETLGSTLPWNTLDELRAQMYKVAPQLMRIDQRTAAPTNELADLAKAKGPMSGEAFHSPVTDFYMTNPIARASKTMAECSALKNVRNLEAAE